MIVAQLTNQDLIMITDNDIFSSLYIIFLNIINYSSSSLSDFHSSILLNLGMRIHRDS